LSGPATTVRDRSVVIHGHFYQPPREDPWTGQMPREASAAPYHDWNRRVHDECYGPVTAARILDAEGRIARVVNTLEWISFDVGPTLLRWLAKQEPDTYGAVLAGDRASRDRLGHGNALACPYHHVILPLASRRDKVTEVRWGIADFRRSFGREPEGMWLPEAAVDLETLEVLAEEGIRFTIVGPGQVESAPADGLPGTVRLGGSKSIALFVYDGALSHDVGFGRLLKDADEWAARMRPPGTGRLTMLATDGETFGHHHRWADMALAAVVERMAAPGGPRFENAASFLARNPPTEEIEIVEPSSWSCVHGVDRWRLECGCKMAPHVASQQAWRPVLRQALDELAGALHECFEEAVGRWLERPWDARDAYGTVLEAPADEKRTWLRARARAEPSDGDVDRVLALLEVERDALRMFTSCGWFFDDVAGLEPLQVLRYAAHALDRLGGPDGEALEARLVAALADAESNDPAAGDAASLWRARVRTGVEVAVAPRRDDELTGLVRAAADGPNGADPARVDEAARRVRALAESGTRVPDAVRAAAWRGLVESAPEDRPILAPLLDALGFATDREVEPLHAHGPLHFVLGLHLHQPVGNFDSVFRSHTENVYEPFLAALEERHALPVTVHVSGPLLDWLERHAHPFLDRIGRLASEGAIEMLLSGFWEPVLPALSSADRIDQIAWMRAWLASRLGVDARGLWLTERVWEQGLVGDLADAGVEYVFIDDRHLEITGLERRALHAPFRTEGAGRALTVLPIDERLRYLVPFRPPSELATYLRRLGAEGRRAAILADDGEKFGGWPGTREWVWESGWLPDFVDTLEELVDHGDIRLSTAGEMVDEVPSGGLVYVPSASYREMEAWSLPPRQANRVVALLDKVRAEPGAEVLVRGGHWRNFLARYPESNRMHRKAQALSELCRERGSPGAARRAIGRAQCNDAYWHGVFGGLYLRHLRDAIWAELAEAEGLLRAHQSLVVEEADVDADGRVELHVTSGWFAAVVAPHRGGAIEELTLFERRVNLANVLTRSREAYHVPRRSRVEAHAGGEGGMPSIHDLEEGLGFDTLPPFDDTPRSLLSERVLPASATLEAHAAAETAPILDWAPEPMTWTVDQASPDRVVIRLTHDGQGQLQKVVTFEPDGTLTVAYRWDPGAFPDDAWFAPELSLAAEARIICDDAVNQPWEWDIRTISKSESGSEETTQGQATTLRWPTPTAQARFTLRPRSRDD
jgi:alpha-amylase/alpha-mannosidase (GH57 family)